MVTPLAYYDLIETFAKPGCAICTLLERDTTRFISSFLYEYANTRDSHKAFRKSRGLCNEHAWRLPQTKGSSLGTAILYRAVVDEVLQAIGDGTQELSRLGFGRSTSGLADKLDPEGPCMVCKSLDDAAQSYFKIFSQYIGDVKVQESFATSEGFCLPHFQQVLRQPLKPEQLQSIVRLHKKKWDALHVELTEFVDKNRHDRMAEQMGSERDSWLRAIYQLSGAKGIFGNRRK